MKAKLLGLLIKIKLTNQFQLIFLVNQKTKKVQNSTTGCCYLLQIKKVAMVMQCMNCVQLSKLTRCNC